MKVAFLGLGAIGRPMAGHLAREPFDLTLWNRTAARAAELAVRLEARHAFTPADAAQDAEVVITCMPTSVEVEGLLDGEDGLLSGLGTSSVLVDCTSGDPATSRRIAERLSAVGVHFLDAPVSGGTVGAEHGILTIMCGGDSAVLHRVRPVLEAFGDRIVHCGEVGAGHAVKAVNNALLAINLYAAAEGLSVLARAGVAPGVALSVINASSGRSNATENLIPERVLDRSFPRTFRLALLEKDIGIAAGIAAGEDVTAPILQLAARLWHAARAELGEEADHVEVVKVVERAAGVELHGVRA